MRKKYFFFDIDGTLTDNKTHKIVPSAKRTLDQLKANGHFVSIATAEHIIKPFPLQMKLIFIILSAMVADVLLLMIR